jgi:hypothetical protein
LERRGQGRGRGRGRGCGCGCSPSARDRAQPRAPHHTLIRYEGDWADDARDGYGREARANGDSYEGEWAADQRHGHGRFVSLHGDVYEGGWVHGQRSGQGVSTVMPPDEVESARLKVSAQLLAHRRKHFLRLPGAGEM